MLNEIYIKNYLLVPELRLSFKPGLTVITGETGAGKSILVGSFGIIFGDSPAGLEAWDIASAIYLEATFSISQNHELREYLKSINADIDDDLVLAREISPAGKSAYYIGGRRVAAAVMKSLKPMLMDFHHQRDQQNILMPSYQLELLDRYAGAWHKREDFRNEYRELKRIRAELNEMIHKQDEKKHLMELYRYQFAELETAAIKSGEDTALQREYDLLSNSRDILELSMGINQEIFESEDSIFDKLRYFLNKLEQYKGLNNAVDNAITSLKEAMEALNSSSTELSEILDSIGPDPARISAIEERLNQINLLLHKHKVKTVDNLIQLFEQREQEILAADNFEKAIDEMHKQLEGKYLNLARKAEELSDIRCIAAKKLSKELQESIRNLAMKEARLEIRIDKKLTSDFDNSNTFFAFGETGHDSVEFLFSANAGTKLKSLAAVASGGEMSRILLGIKKLLVSKESLRLLILDEIDAGIGGKTADNVAKCIADISSSNPVLCITHLAQIAVLADTHIAVTKIADAKTKVELRILSDDERIKEVARMLSGNCSQTALKHAEELILRHN